MSEEIRGRTIGQFALVDATTLDADTARIPVWREEQADGNRVAAITPEGLKALLIAGGLLTQDAADDLYAPIGSLGGNGGGPTNSADPLPAASALSALRIVSRTGDAYAYADPTSTNSVWAIAGLTPNAFALGETCTPIRDQPITDAGWNWELGKPIMLASNGALTQSDAAGWGVQVAYPLSPQTIFIQIERPIEL